MLAYEIFMKTEQTPSAYEGHFIKLKDQENAGKWTLTLGLFWQISWPLLQCVFINVTVLLALTLLNVWI